MLLWQNREKIKGEQSLGYNLTIWNKNDAFDIINDVNKFFYFDTANWLNSKYESFYQYSRTLDIWFNYGKSRFLRQELLDLICSPSIDEEKVPTFWSVLHTVG